MDIQNDGVFVKLWFNTEDPSTQFSFLINPEFYSTCTLNDVISCLIHEKKYDEAEEIAKLNENFPELGENMLKDAIKACKKELERCGGRLVYLEKQL